MARRRPASIRFNNPGAQYPGPSARRFGSNRFAVIGGGHRIAIFDDPIVGAAAQFDLLNRGYVGRTLRSAIEKWSGGNFSSSYVRSVSRETGIKANDVLTSELIAGPQGVALVRSMARHEAGEAYPLTHEQWAEAQKLALGARALIEQARRPPEEAARTLAVARQIDMTDPSTMAGMEPDVPSFDGPAVAPRPPTSSPDVPISPVDQQAPPRALAPVSGATGRGGAAQQPWGPGGWATQAFARGDNEAVEPVEASARISPLPDVPPPPPRHEVFGAWTPGQKNPPVFKSLLMSLFGGGGFGAGAR
jgi:hypothetical protein